MQYVIARIPAACVIVLTLLSNDAQLNSLTRTLYVSEIEESKRRILKYAQEIGFSQTNI